MSAGLDEPLCTLAFCWRIERRDGVTIGLTSHDRDLEMGGLTYRAAPGMTPSAVRSGIGLDGDDSDVAGALSSDAISESDLMAGRWDGAALELRLTQWEEPGALWLLLAAGEIGAVSRKGSSFSAELIGAAAVLGAPVAPSTSPDCRARLGDRACRVDLAARRRIVSVAGVEAAEVAVSGLAAGVYAFGTLRWLSGPNAGLVQAVVDNGADGVTLADPPAFAVTAGTLALLTEGCDRQLATCAGRFGNAVNFRGEPYLPGMDLLTRYPGA
ncbi:MULTISPECIES: DUF2163 domain-containing protein [unclassified Sphingobium]|uniref:DUF2163 domain-containing protein n=1 Tax=unclassified Sphingobium TaxID=2611147 RepID=UPI0007F4B31E|nr:MULTISPECIES: DUF2163 domain-containing protein [unclassified Sphingobium]OAN53553.1 hypothetical protein A7Q26_05945 [Sphingobium sp. TCM1]WIW87237.1 DUF2163 domain-containing protein [Sphingobium sp. V4]